MRGAGVICVVLLLFVLTIAVEAQDSTDIGYLEIMSTPPGAEVFLSGNYIGKTPLQYPYIQAGSPARLQLSLEGYAPYDYIMNTDSSLRLHAWLVPAVAFSSLIVHSNPSGALVTLNNGKAQSTPWTYRNIAPGQYLVHIEYFGFASYTGYVDLAAGETITLSVPLVLRDVYGSLQMSSIPAGADIFIDGVSYGKTNKVVGSLAPGPHAIMIQHPKHEIWYGTVEIVPKAATYISAELIPKLDA